MGSRVSSVNLQRTANMVKVANKRARAQAHHRRRNRSGEDHPAVVLSNHELDLLDRLRADGMSYRELGRKFEVSPGHAHDLVHRRRRRVRS